MSADFNEPVTGQYDLVEACNKTYLLNTVNGDVWQLNGSGEKLVLVKISTKGFGEKK